MGETGGLCVKLEETKPDLRSRRKLFKVTAVNNGSKPLFIYGYSVNHSPKGKLVECAEEFLIRQNEKFERVKAQLRFLGESLLVSKFPDIGESVMNAQQATVLSALKAIQGSSFFYGLVGDILMKLLDKTIRSAATIQANSVYIGSYDEGELFLDTMIPEERERETPLCRLFRFTLEQLKKLETKFSDTKKPVVTLEPGESYSPPVTVDYARDLFDTRRERVEVVFDYSRESAPGTITRPARAETETDVSPMPGVLSFITMLSSLLGAVVLHRDGLKSLRLPELFEPGLRPGFAQWLIRTADAHMVFVTHGIMGMILSFLLFNVYELIQFKFTFLFKVDWRGALLFGFVCGYFSEWIVSTVLPGLRSFTG